jgi:hypothetical protein
MISSSTTTSTMRAPKAATMSRSSDPANALAFVCWAACTRRADDTGAGDAGAGDVAGGEVAGRAGLVAALMSAARVTARAASRVP